MKKNNDKKIEDSQEIDHKMDPKAYLSKFFCLYFVTFVVKLEMLGAR